MSERLQHRNKAISLTIDGKECSGVYGETILQIARRNDIYIPTMCNLSKVSPIASCRMCVVNIKNVDGDILSCQEKAVNGIDVTINNEHLEHERTNIMKLYNVNHPLECGVCDKSGECDLQNKTLEFGVDSQEFAVKDLNRKNKKWGILGYDPSLCIMCEKCVHTCNETIGAAALYIKPGGYKSTIDIKMSKCEQCGECISVCPVGALISNEYKYTSNAWETDKVPATCAHCPSACELIYDVKHESTSNPHDKKIYRVTNNSEYGFLCGSGKFAFEFENKNTTKSDEDFNKAVNALKNANTIKFNSYITNEEAFILQKLKDKLKLNLVNDDAKNYQNFLNEYSKVTGKSLYSANSQTVIDSDAIIMIGTFIARDNPGIKYNINRATKRQRAEFIYMHPLDDTDLSNKYTQYVNYEVGSEEAVIALLTNILISEMPNEIKGYLDELNLPNLMEMSNISDDQIELIKNKLIRRRNKTLIIGTDIYGHKNAKNIAKLVALIDLYSDFDVLIMPSQTNTLGVSLICELDDEIVGNVVGYNEAGDYTIASSSECDFNVPALNQQEGSFTSLDLKVSNTNAGLLFDGYCLNDLANEILEDNKEYTIEYTNELSINSEYKDIKFDDLKNGYDKYGKDIRGYELNNCDVDIGKIDLDEIAEVESFDGAVIYRCEPMHQFNEATSDSLILKSDSNLKGSAQFAKIANIKAGDNVSIELNGRTIIKKFKVDKTIKCPLALYAAFDDGLVDNDISLGYRYKKVNIEKVES